MQLREPCSVLWGDPNEKEIQKKGGIYEYIELIDFAIQQKSNTTL